LAAGFGKRSEIGASSNGESKFAMINWNYSLVIRNCRLAESSVLSCEISVAVEEPSERQTVGGCWTMVSLGEQNETALRMSGSANVIVGSSQFMDDSPA
jgi:hypothetical protein